MIKCDHDIEIVSLKNQVEKLMQKIFDYENAAKVKEKTIEERAKEIEVRLIED